MEQTYKIFKALADKTRLEIAAFLAKKEKASCGEISKHFTLSQPTLSHHFKKLEAAEIIIVEKQGVSNYYSINKPLLKKHGINL